MTATLTATWDEERSRVRLDLTGATAAATATFSSRLGGTNTWTVVRGAFEVPVTDGETRTVDDYEFPVSTDYPALLLGDDLLLGPDTLTGGSTAEYKVVTDNDLTATTSCGTDLYDQTWLKFPGYPQLNRQITVVGRSAVTRQSRSQVLPIIATGSPAAVGEHMTSRGYSLTLRTTSWPDYRELDTALALGSVVFIHADDGALGLPSVYAVVDGYSSAPVGKMHGRVRHTELNLVEVGRPNYYYAGAVATLATLLDAYDTLADLLAAYDTLAQLRELEGVAADVIVP